MQFKHFVKSQCSPVWKTGTIGLVRSLSGGRIQCLNVVRSGRPEQSIVRGLQCLERRSLNVVRSGRPEQFGGAKYAQVRIKVSQCSPVWKTGTIG